MKAQAYLDEIRLNEREVEKGKAHKGAKRRGPEMPIMKPGKFLVRPRSRREY